MTDGTEGSILILDDDSIVTRTLETLLAEESRWKVCAFTRPSEALNSLDDRKYDAVLSDFLMPEMDGVQFLKQVRQRQPMASRILLTGYADKQNAIRSINEAGLYYYVEKPWDNDNLLLVLRNAVERSVLIRDLDDRMQSLARRDHDLEDLRGRLLKAIL